MEKRLFTSESVTEGHPDKLCDAVSDAILDALLEQDPMSRVACETCTTTGYVMVMGEITSKAQIDIQQIVRDTVREIGYDRAKYGFDADTCAVIVALDKQSTDIAMGVDKALEAKENNMSDEEIDAIGAGDQGMMFGFASNETDEYMPYPIYLAHKLARQLTKVRKDGTLSYLRPDGKTQVTVEYDENGKPFRLDAVVLSTQHDPEVSQEQIHEDIKKYVFNEIIPADMVDVTDELSKEGFNISIDDFGTAHANIYSLADLAVSEVKFDKKLIDNIAKKNNEKLTTILSVLITMCKKLGIKTIAEGVEDKEQSQILKNLGCDEIQGYYFSRPIKDEDYYNKLS